MCPVQSVSYLSDQVLLSKVIRPSKRNLGGFLGSEDVTLNVSQEVGRKREIVVLLIAHSEFNTYLVTKFVFIAAQKFEV